MEWELDETEAALFSADDDAVRLLTIHGSKGLAFPTVILADADAVEQPGWAPVAILRRAQARPLLVVRHAGEDGPIVTDTQKALSEDSKARAQAERQRLSYVALTRAQHEIVVALPAKARSGTLAKTVLDLQAEGAFDRVDGYRELAVSELLATAKLSRPGAEAASEPPTLPRDLETSAVVLGVTALSDFQICPRRFDLIQLHGLSEPRRGPSSVAGPDTDPRLAGIAAHAVLELWPLERWGEAPDPQTLAQSLAQSGLSPSSPAGLQTLAGLTRFLSGPYAALVRRDAVRVERELSLTIALAGRPEPRRATHQLELFAAPKPTPLVVKATLDLLVELKDGSLHVIDYKRTRGGAGTKSRYEPQLGLYRAVVCAHFGRSPQLGLLHLLGDAAEPEWLEPSELDPAALASAFLAARASDRWPHVARPVCEAVHCGFVESCHFNGNA
jgi:ATP-dependent helicase/nuclease subunit A